MTIPLKHAYSLVRRGGPGLACDEDGLTLGTLEVARVRQDAMGVRRCELRSPGEIDQILLAAFGPQPDGVAARIHRGLRRTAACIEAGDLGRAGVEAVKLALPGLSPDAIAKLSAIADDLEKAGDAWQEQPRIPAGQNGGGQWTDGAGGGQAANPSPTAKPPSPAVPPVRPKPPPGPPASDGPGLIPPARSLLVHVSTPSIAIGAPGARGPVAQSFPLPRVAVPRVTPLQLVITMARLLNDLDDKAARGQIQNAISRFGLDPSRPSDVMAAAAYVRARYVLPGRLDVNIPFRGPALDAASEAVMRYVMIHPDSFPAMMQGDRHAYSAIMGAADRGLADYVWESRRRPDGVDPELQTTSETARAAIASMLKTGQMQAHHLVPAMAWGRYIGVAKLAHDAGWEVDSPSNLIGLPANAETQEQLLAEFHEYLPIHNFRGHPQYNINTLARLSQEGGDDLSKLTRFRARAILEKISEENRQLILSGEIGPIMKVVNE